MLKLKLLFLFINRDDPSNVLFSANYTKVEGGSFGGFDYDSGYRISEGYAKLAKKVAADIKKKAK